MTSLRHLDPDQARRGRDAGPGGLSHRADTTAPCRRCGQRTAAACPTPCLRRTPTVPASTSRLRPTRAPAPMAASHHSNPSLDGDRSGTAMTVTSGALNVPRPSLASRASGDRSSCRGPWAAAAAASRASGSGGPAGRRPWTPRAPPCRGERDGSDDSAAVDGGSFRLGSSLSATSLRDRLWEPVPVQPARGSRGSPWESEESLRGGGQVRWRNVIEPGRSRPPLYSCSIATGLLRLLDGIIGTLISPSMIDSRQRFSCGRMSSMEPPLKASPKAPVRSPSHGSVA